MNPLFRPNLTDIKIKKSAKSGKAVDSDSEDGTEFKPNAKFSFEDSAIAVSKPKYVMNFKDSLVNAFCLYLYR